MAKHAKTDKPKYGDTWYEDYIVPFHPAKVQPPAPVPAPPPGPLTYRTSLANIMSNSDATVAQVRFEVRDPRDGSVQGFDGSGASKRERGDKHDPVTGEILAAARAYGELSARLHRTARSRIHAQDAEKQQKERRAEKKRQAKEAEPSPENITRGEQAARAFSDPDTRLCIPLTRGRYLTITSQAVMLHQSSGGVVSVMARE